MTFKNENEQFAAAEAMPEPTRRADRSDERQQFLADVFTIGLEGGIGYWSEATRYKWEQVDTFNAVILPISGENEVDGVPAWGIWDDDDERETAPLRIDADVIARGLGLYRRWVAGEIDYNGKEVPEANRRPRPGLAQVVKADDTNYREGDIDAGDADNIIQWGLFGCAVYG